MKKILLIGGCGYIGSGLYVHLTSHNHTVTTIDVEWFGNVTNPHNLKQDFSLLDNNFVQSFDVVILLAGHSSVKMCENNMQATFENNVANFVTLLAKIGSDQKFIYASSSSVYNNADTDECTENLSLSSNPTNGYDLSKREIDWYASLSGKHYYGLRLGTVNGYAPNLRTDLMINAMYNSALTHNEISLFNPKIKRPILGIKDLNSAVEAIVTSTEKNPGIYNLASFNSTAEEIATAVSSYCSVPVFENENPGTIINTKLQTNAYDFKINSDKFCDTFNFAFAETTNSILGSLNEGFKKAHKSMRTDAIAYER